MNEIRKALLFIVCSLLLVISHASSDTLPSCTTDIKSSFVKPKTLIDGILNEIDINESSEDDKNSLAKVFGCCSKTSSSTSLQLSQEVIGYMPQFTTEQTSDVLQSSIKAWDSGTGVWPQMSIKQRMNAIENVFQILKKEKREDIVNVLMWEIGKNRKDAESEFDRTIQFVEQLLSVLKDETNIEFNNKWSNVGATKAFIRRAAIGIIMCLGPFNYPLNETYATLIPALLMGNIIILKIPTVGGLVHLLTMEAFAKSLPPGTINFVSGSGRRTMPPLMKSGNIDGLAFIGGSNAADNLIRDHPNPHRLKLFLQLEAKNLGIFLPDLFDGDSKMLDNAIDQAVLGSLNYNGQRCTALKLLFVPKKHAHKFLSKFVLKVDELTIGLPWQKFDINNKYSQITPLPNKQRVMYMQELISDAMSKGGNIINKDGSAMIGNDENDESTLMVPAVIYPVTKDMKLYHEEQFGPVVPIVTYDDVSEVIEYAKMSKYAQQCAIFTNSQTQQTQKQTSKIIDIFSSIFGKINLNSQCGRSPDILPFSGRRSSALGIMSVMDSLKEFSIPTVVSYKENSFLAGDDSMNEEKIMSSIQDHSLFMQ